MCTNRKRDGQLARSLALYLGILIFPTALLAKTTSSLSLSETNLSFGSVTVSATSSARVVTVSNSGQAALVFSGISVSGDYSQSNTCRVALKGGATCTISVAFSPTSAGSRSGIVTINDN